MREQIKQLLKVSEASYFRWKKERPIFKLLEKYFSSDELKEFLQTDKIEKLDLIKNFSVDELKEKLYGIKNETKKPQYNISNLLTKVSLLTNSQVEAFIYFLKQLKKKNLEFNKENLKLINDSFIAQLLNVFVELKLNHLYFSKSDKERLLIWFDSFLDQNDFNYINENKELVVKELEKVKKFFGNEKPKETKKEQKNDEQLGKEKEQKEATNEVKKETKKEQEENKKEKKKNKQLITKDNIEDENEDEQIIDEEQDWQIDESEPSFDIDTSGDCITIIQH